MSNEMSFCRVSRYISCDLICKSLMCDIVKYISTNALKKLIYMYVL